MEAFFFPPSKAFTKQQQLGWWFLSTTNMGGYGLAKAWIALQKLNHQASCVTVLQRD